MVQRSGTEFDFQSALLALSDGVVTTDALGNILFLNSSAEKVTGWVLSEVMGRRVEDVVNITIENAVYPAVNPISAVLNVGQRIERPNYFLLISKEGTVVPIELSAVRTRNSNGEMTGAIIVFHRVSEKGHSRDQLQANFTHLELAMEAGQMGAWEWHVAEQKVSWTPTLEAIHGMSPGTFGGTFDDFKRDIHTDDLQRVLQTIQSTLQSEQNSYKVEYRIIKPDQTIAWIESHGRLTRNAEGLPEKMSGLCADVSSRRAVEAALRRSEQFSRSVIESSRDCIKILDLNGKLTWISEAGQKALGVISAHDVVDRYYVDFWINEERELAAQAIQKAQAGGVGHFVGYFPVKGIPHWWDVVITAILGANGNPEQLLAISRDVTALRKAEEAMHLHAAVVESSDDAIISKTLDGIIRTWNAGAQRIFGYAPEEVIGRHISILIPQDHISEESEIIRQLQLGQRIEHFETVRRRKDGKTIDVSLSVSAVKNSDGRIIGASKIAREITARKKAAEELQARTRRLEILNDTGKMIASNLDLQSLVQAVTDAGTHLSGAQLGAFFYTVTNDKGESFQLFALSGAPRETFEHFGLPRNTAIFNPTFKGEKLVRSDDITKDPNYGKTGPHFGMPKGHFPVRSYLAVPVKLRSSEVVGGLFFGHSEAGKFDEAHERLIVGIAAQAGIAIDNARLYGEAQKEIARRTKAEDKMYEAKKEADRANRAKDEFLAIVSHELRTPLTSILGWTRMLMSGELDAKKAEHGILVIERNVKLQTQLIEDLLDVSRVISGKLELRINPVDLGKVAAAAIDSINSSADAKQIKVELICPEQIVTSGDSGRLQQIFWNLLSNSVKFTQNGGHVKIHLIARDAEIHVTVSDNGKGIEPHFLPHLFERFRQLDSTTTRTYGGLGLGLAIVRHLVEQHGGTITAHSDGVGKGAQFSIVLPLRKTLETPPLLPAIRQPSGKPLLGKQILVVEDAVDSRDVIVTLLNAAGATVTSVSSADAGLAEIGRHLPDVIVSDIGMPRKDGYEFIREVRCRPVNQGGQVPALALTAFAREEDHRRALQAGFNAHITKPFDPEALVEIVDQTLRLSQTKNMGDN